MQGYERSIAAQQRRVSSSEFVFRRGSAGRTFLGHQYAAYPFHICRPHYFEGDPAGMATLYLQSVAGGIFEGDRLSLQISAEPYAHLHATSQASTIVHGMEHGWAEQTVTIEAGENTFVEYLPDATILFPKAKLSSRLRINAHETATVLAADSFLAHDPSGKGAMFDWFANDLSVVDGTGKAIVKDRFQISGDLLTRKLAGLNGTWMTQATVIVINRQADIASLLEEVRRRLNEVPETYSGASELPDRAGIGVRILASDGHALRTAVLSVWSSLRVQSGMATPSVRRK